MRELEIRDEGERLIPEAAYGSISYAEHIARYHFASQFVRAKRVLDVASGVGYGADLLKRNATRVVAADNSLEAAQYGSKHHANYGPDFLVSDAEALALRGGQFDVVVSFETIEHVPHYDRLLKEVKRVLHKEGLLIISTPNKGVYPEGNRFHVNEFALEEFEEVLRRHFSNVTILAQQNWVMSSILSLDAMEERDAPVAGPVTAFKVAGLPRVSTLYTVALCSNGPLPEAAAQTLELSGLYQTAVGEKDSHIINIEAALADTQAALAPVQVARDELQAALAEKDAVLAQKDAHIVDIETALYQANVQAAAAQHQLNLITGSAGYRLLELVRRPIRWLAPQGTRRHLGVKAAARALNILVSEGPWTLVRRALPVWRWLPRLRRGFVVQQGGTLDDEYQLWLKAHELTPARTRRIRRAAASLAYRPLVSIVMPVYNPDPAWLRDA
ncbi:MAG: methyltransferase domain-containing protein, partial [Dehalococcoidia bacterium]|nr:methyltransferase domain-containing protein [Dehalococcoidia bacterium]